jgi:hypothetical protein
MNNETLIKQYTIGTPVINVDRGKSLNENTRSANTHIRKSQGSNLCATLCGFEINLFIL